MLPVSETYVKFSLQYLSRITLADASNAATETNAGPDVTFNAVSNPLLPAVAKTVRSSEVLPPNAVQDDTLVAPFQDVYIVRLVPTDSTLMLGLV